MDVALVKVATGSFTAAMLSGNTFYEDDVDLLLTLLKVGITEYTPAGDFYSYYGGRNLERQ